jgi:hypothetical protein
MRTDQVTWVSDGARRPCGAGRSSMKIVPITAAATTSARPSVARRDEDVEDGRARGPIAGDGYGQGGAEEAFLRDGVEESDGEHQGCS